MTAINDITKDRLISKTNNKAFNDNWDRIFGKKGSKKEESVNDTDPTAGDQPQSGVSTSDRD